MNALLNHRCGISPAQDRVWAQVTGLAPSIAVGRLLMALSFQTFIDDSRSQDEFILAGHIASAEAWAHFSKEWEQLLPLGTLAKNDKYHFKMSEMALIADRMARVPVFYRAVEEYAVISISCRMNMEVYNRALARVDYMSRPPGLQSSVPNVRILIDHGLWKNPYRFMFRALMDTFHSNRQMFADKLPLDQKVDFIFDNQTEKKPILEEWDLYIAQREDEVRPFYGATPRFEDDQEFLPLQAADLWAWWVREWYEEDNCHSPEKLRSFDFSKWQGKKKRPLIIMSATEDQIFDFIQSRAMDAAIAADEDIRQTWPSLRG